MQLGIYKKSIYSSIVSIILTVYPTLLQGQDLGYQGAFFFQPVTYNPALLSVKGTYIDGSFTQRWLGFANAPQTSALSGGTPLFRSFNIGGSMLLSREGALSVYNPNFIAAYNLELNGGNKLYFGLSGGVLSYGVNESLFYEDNDDVIPADRNDQLLDQYQQDNTFGIMGLGFSYRAPEVGFGVSVNNFLLNTSDFIERKPAYNAFFDLYIPSGKNFVFKAQLFGQYTKVDWHADVYFTAIYRQKLHMGALYRYNRSAGINILYHLTLFIEVGVSYEYALFSNFNLSKQGTPLIYLALKLPQREKVYSSIKYF